MTTAIPSTSAELEEFLADSAKVNQSFEDGTFKDVIKAYAQSVAPQITDELKAETQKTIADWIKDNWDKYGTTPVDVAEAKQLRPGAQSKYTGYNAKAAGAELDGVFDDKATFFQAIWHNAEKSKYFDADMKAKRDKISNWSTTVPSEGGFLVPEEFRSELLQLSLESAVVRPRATVIPMTGGKLHIPMVDETTHNGSLFGGITFHWTEEGGELEESQAKFAAVKLEPWKLTGLAHVPNELVRDWAGLGAFLGQSFPTGMAFTEDSAFLKADGVGKPLGALHSSNGAIISVAAEAGQPAATIVWENVLKMYSRMLPSSLATAVWIASPDVFVQLATMALNVGTGGSAVWLVDAHGTPVLTLLGRPVIMTEKAPGTLGAAGDLSFVDLRFYLIGDRQAMEAMSSPHVKFTSDKTSYRIIERVDGTPWLQSPITPENGGPTLSPMVQLAARP